MMFAESFRMPYTSHVDGFANERLPPPHLWPEFRFDLPELQYPERLNCGVVLIDDAVREGHGARVALYFGAIRSAPSRRIVSPLSITFSTM